jgi:hypothetical protein
MPVVSGFRSPDHLSSWYLSVWNETRIEKLEDTVALTICGQIPDLDLTWLCLSTPQERNKHETSVMV